MRRRAILSRASGSRPANCHATALADETSITGQTQFGSTKRTSLPVLTVLTVLPVLTVNPASRPDPQCFSSRHRHRLPPMRGRLTPCSGQPRWRPVTPRLPASR